MGPSRTCLPKRAYLPSCYGNAAWAVILTLAGTATLAVSALAEENSRPLQMVIHPAPAPYPALKYRFHPDLADRFPGNAAVEYGKVTAEGRETFCNNDLWKDLLRWLEAPLPDLRNDRVYEKTRFEKIYGDLDRAAACEYCDWQLPIGRQPFYSILLSELQQTRSFGRLLGVRARAQIAEGRFEDAIDSMRAGYRLAQHVDDGQTLIHSLVSAAIAQILSAQIREFIQQPGAPNLYWALTSLPRPLVEVRSAIDGERDILDLTFTELREVEQANWPAERWQEFLDRLAAGLVEYQQLDGQSDAGRLLAERTPRLLPRAKQYLIDHGSSREQVEAMSVPQVVVLYSVRLYNELRDEMLKWYYLPYWQARKPMERVAERIERISKEEQEILPLASSVLPPMLRARNTLVRVDREIALHSAIEALRMYGAAHESRLPTNWSDITEVAVPHDPVTGEAFQYSLRENVALIEGSPLPDTPYVVQGSPRPDIRLQVEIRFAK